jgi:hypothetical protein
MSDNAGFNRQLNRQQKALVASAGLLFGQSILRRIFYRDGVDGYRDKTFNYFRPK